MERKLGNNPSLTVRHEIPTAAAPDAFLRIAVLDRVPEIVVEQPAGNVIAPAGGTIDFGQRLIGDPVEARAITLRNTGQADLAGITASITEGGEEFALLSAPPQFISPGRTESFWIGFSPQWGGLRKGTLVITSNDDNESTYEISLRGIVGGTVDILDFEEDGWRYFVTPIGLGDSEIAAGDPPHEEYGSENWKHPDFDDSGWPAGRAMLGYGRITSRTINTTIGFGGIISNRYPTSYFRKEIQIEGADSVSQLLLQLIRDDGAIVYLNGHEIGRSNVPAGNLSYDDLAQANIGASEGDIVFLDYIPPPGLVREGTNILAVEVHQNSRGSEDLGIDLRLQAISFAEDQ